MPSYALLDMYSLWKMLEVTGVFFLNIHQIFGRPIFMNLQAKCFSKVNKLMENKIYEY